MIEGKYKEKWKGNDITLRGARWRLGKMRSGTQLQWKEIQGNEAAASNSKQV